MPGRARVLIVVTCYNDGKYLNESVGSAVDLAQSAAELADITIKIADDGSTEYRTVEVLERFERTGFEVARFPHRNIGATRNRALATATADWFIPLDADNRLRTTVLHDLLPFATSPGPDSPGPAAVYGDAMKFGDAEGRWAMGPTDIDRLWRENHIDSCALIRLSAWRSVGGYSESLNGLEDWDLWLSFIEAEFVIAYRPVIAFDYRVRSDSLSHARYTRFNGNRVTPLTTRGIQTVNKR